MDKHKVVCTHNGILFHLQKERNHVDAKIWINDNDVRLSEINHSKKDKNCDFTYMRYQK
jgi:hypothetical protein